MKNIGYLLLAVLLVAVVALAAGCDKAPEQKTEPDSSTASEPVTVTTFKPGVWNSDADVQYIFYEDGKGGKTVSATDGMGLGFEYELAADGSCVFHMGSADQIDKATVEFTDSDTATITWENGSKVFLQYVGKAADADNSDM